MDRLQSIAKNGSKTIKNIMIRDRDGNLYMQTIIYNEYMFTDEWFDTKGNIEEFETTITGYDKKGNPIFNVDTIYSNITLYNDKIRYFTIHSWRESLPERIADN